MEMALGAVLLALLASAAFGVSDSISGAAVRTQSAASLALWAQLTGLVVLGTAFVVRRPGVAAEAAVWGAAAGVVGALAVLAFYSALQKGAISIVAPVAGTGGLVPIAVGLLQGDSVGWIAIVGVLAAVVGVVVIAAAGDADGDTVGNSFSPQPPVDHVGSLGWARLRVGTPGAARPLPVYDGCVPTAGGERHRPAVVAAVLAAVGFGGFFVVLDQATEAQSAAGAAGFDDSLAVALLVQVGAVVVTSLAAARHTWECMRPTRSLLLVGPAVGLLDVVADFSLTSAVTTGPLSLVGPLGGLDPVVTVLIATAVLRERLSPAQLLGVTLAVAGAVAVGIG